MRSRLARVLGVTIGLLGIVYVVRLVFVQRDDLRGVLDRLEPATLLLALLLGLVGMTIIGVAWNALLASLDRPLPVAAALRAYFVGQLGKYLPGGVWAIVGRGEWARMHGARAAAAYGATVYSIATAYVAAALVTGAVAALALPDVGSRPLVALVGVGGVAGTLALHPALGARALGLLRRSTGRDLAIEVPRVRVVLAVLAAQAVTWLAIGTGSHLVARGLGIDVAWSAVVVATACSWLIGFLALPVPGGIGVREGVFVGVLGAGGEAAVIALAARFVAIGVDVVGASIATVAARRALGRVLSGLPGRSAVDGAVPNGAGDTHEEDQR